MPKNSQVHKVYEALKRKGMGSGKAARIAQAQSGEALATGKPVKLTRDPAEDHGGDYDYPEESRHKVVEPPEAPKPAGEKMDETIKKFRQ